MYDKVNGFFEWRGYDFTGAVGVTPQIHRLITGNPDGMPLGNSEIRKTKKDLPF